MIYNRPRRAKKKQLTWYFNDTLTLPFGSAQEGKIVYAVKFKARGESWKSLVLQKSYMSFASMWMSAMRFSKYSDGSAYQSAWSNTSGWYNTASRTITFDEEPTGDLLTWLQANATPQ